MNNALAEAEGKEDHSHGSIKARWLEILINVETYLNNAPLSYG